LNKEKNNVYLLISGNVVKSKRGQIIERQSKNLENNVAVNKYKEALKDAVRCICQVRCNVFHGDKEYIEFIKPCLPILRNVIRTCLINYVR